MAALEEDPNRDLTCVICFSLFKVPTTLICGHTFCAQCLQRLWSKPGVSRGYKCPMCNQEYTTQPSLNKNTTIAALVEKEKARAGGAADREAGCQDCEGDRVAKLCLDCGEQYCAAHISPHRQGGHLLLSPLGEEVPWPCRSHSRPMEFYCPLHTVPVCAQCGRQEHASCQPTLLLPLLQTRLENQDHRLKDIAADIDMKEQALLKRKSENEHIQKSICELKKKLGTEFSEIKKYIAQQEGATWERIDNLQKGAQQKINESIVLLTSELAQQKEIKGCMEKSTEDNWLELLKKSDSALGIGSAPVSCVEDISLDNGEIVSLTTAVTELKRVIFEKTVTGINTLGLKPDENVNPSPSQPISSSLVANGCSTDSLECPSYIRPIEFVECAVTVTFDPNTVSWYLGLANENSKVIISKKKLPHPASPVRFINNQVLCSQNFLKGRHYWEIEMKDCEGWAVGIANQSISKTDSLGRTVASWCLEWSNKSLSAWHANQQTPIMQPCSPTIGIFLDCETHVLSFHSVADNFTLLHTYKGDFSYPVFPAFWLYGLKKGGSLTINPVVKNG